MVLKPLLFIGILEEALKGPYKALAAWLVPDLLVNPVRCLM